MPDKTKEKKTSIHDRPGIKSKTEIVLKALMQGITVDLGLMGLYGAYKHITPEDAEVKYPEVATVHKDQEDNPIYYTSDITLNQFIDQCEKMSDDEIAGICMTLTMMSTRKKRD